MEPEACSTQLADEEGAPSHCAQEEHTAVLLPHFFHHDSEANDPYCCESNVDSAESDGEVSREPSDKGAKKTNFEQQQAPLRLF